MIKCIYCDKELDYENDIYTTPDDEPCCEDCWDERCAVCDYCERTVYQEDMLVVNPNTRAETYVCTHCAEHFYYRCDDCGDYFDDDYIYQSRARDVCHRCYEEGYTTCENCGDVIPYDEAVERNGEHYCEYCAPDEEDENIHDYSYKPTPKFCKGREEEECSQTRYYGVELEVDDGDDPGSLAAELFGLDAPIYCKHDSSLNNGLEIVTEPCTLQYHADTMPWEDICALCTDAGFTSHDAETCGLHIHANRSALPDDAPAKITTLACALQDELTIFSRRKKEALNRWAAWNIPQPEKDAAEEALLERVHSSSKDRYHAVNLTCRDTIEFRFCRGTLKASTILATLQMLDILISYACAHTLTECAQASWGDVFPTDALPAELKEYVHARGIDKN